MLKVVGEANINRVLSVTSPLLIHMLHTVGKKILDKYLFYSSLAWSFDYTALAYLCQ